MSWAGKRSNKALAYVSTNRFIAASRYEVTRRSGAEVDPELPWEHLKEWLRDRPHVRSIAIRLGSSLGRPFVLRVPAELSYEERLVAARAAAARQTGIEQPDVVLEARSLSGVLGVACGANVVRELRRVTHEASVRLHSICPAWHILFENRSAASSIACSLLLEEPDGATLVMRRSSDESPVASFLAAASDSELAIVGARLRTVGGASLASLRLRARTLETVRSTEDLYEQSN